MAQPEARILLVDDDIELAGLMQDFLGAHQLSLRAVHNGAAGLQEALDGQYDLVLLDVMMPGLDGFTVLQRLRAQSKLPVVMLTAAGDARRRIEGLESGADDYLPKPFEPRELLARIRAVLRRTQKAEPDPEQLISIGAVRLHPGHRTVQCAGEFVDITSVEFDILAYLMKEAGTVVSRDQLMQKLYQRDASPFDRSIDVHVSHLRKKLERAGDCIRTVRGAGYLFAGDTVANVS